MNDTYEPIIVEQTFNCSKEDVWNALTNLQEMKQWYFSNLPSFEPTVDFETNFIVQSEDRIFPHIGK